ncbi:Oidioi.mRNA.OKI2018_I69.chr2.g5693.t1.cds [Oikopleura dioica]|uniref:Oidioi.mRNA.OKI2018_I69.chr2.g5693.t1.cds n=1 Tax=Oikopleura dioica TaxID=34765 RepID=A0ABN7T7N1_OIKDI|nr:Oidioi.mRNA.OKI2018_I69.chr2.g5693.t1.cds [Oikopleura dioica]
MCEEGKFSISDLKKSHDDLKGLLEEARKHYKFEAYLTPGKVGAALKNDHRKAEENTNKYGLCRRLLEEPQPPKFHIFRRKPLKKDTSAA